MEGDKEWKERVSRVRWMQQSLGNEIKECTTELPVESSAKAHARDDFELEVVLNWVRKHASKVESRITEYAKNQLVTVWASGSISGS